MARPKIIDYDQLDILLRQKMSHAEIARRLHVNQSSICRAAKNLIKGSAYKVTVMEKAKTYHEKQLTFIEQQEKNTRILNKYLDKVEKYIDGDHTVFLPLQKKLDVKSVEQAGKTEEGGEAKKGGNGKKTKIEQKIETFDFTMDPRVLMVMIIGETRKHMELQAKVMSDLANAQHVLNFQRHIVELIGGANKCQACGGKVVCASCGAEVDLKAWLIKTMKKDHAIRASLVLG